MANYRQVSAQIFNDAKFRKLSCLAQNLFFFILLHPNLSGVGALRATAAGLASEKGVSLAEFEAAYEELEAGGMLCRDLDAPLYWIKNYFKHNPPDGPNGVKGWLKELMRLPECGLLETIKEAARTASGKWQGVLDAGFADIHRAGDNADQRCNGRDMRPLNLVASRSSSSGHLPGVSAAACNVIDMDSIRSDAQCARQGDKMGFYRPSKGVQKGFKGGSKGVQRGSKGAALNKKQVKMQLFGENQLAINYLINKLIINTAASAADEERIASNDFYSPLSFGEPAASTPAASAAAEPAASTAAIETAAPRFAAASKEGNRVLAMAGLSPAAADAPHDLAVKAKPYALPARDGQYLVSHGMIAIWRENYPEISDWESVLRDMKSRLLAIGYRAPDTKRMPIWLNNFLQNIKHGGMGKDKAPARTDKQGKEGWIKPAGYQEFKKLKEAYMQRAEALRENPYYYEVSSSYS